LGQAANDVSDSVKGSVVRSEDGLLGGNGVGSIQQTGLHNGTCQVAATRADITHQ
jgi:hypothetical protein